ncbi:hypothetical protein DSECCO2_498810 [anaerobic digester metagenome]
MKSIPTRLECAYCIRNFLHGGECRGKANLPRQGCLAFKPDQRGCIRSMSITLQLPIYHDFPLIGVWNDEFNMGEKETEFRIKHIHGIRWDKQKGYLGVVCYIDYYINDFDEYYQEPREEKKPVLKLVKGGAE